MPFAVRPEEGLRQKGLERNREREVTGTKDKTNVELPGQYLERLGLNEKQCIKAGRQAEAPRGALRERSSLVVH